MQDGKIVSSSIQLRVHSKMNEIRGQPRDEIWRKERRGKRNENKSANSTFVTVGEENFTLAKAFEETVVCEGGANN